MSKPLKAKLTWLCVLVLFILFHLINNPLANSKSNNTRNLTDISPLAITGCQIANFSAATNFAVNGSGSQAIAAADFNRDGIIDLVTANFLSSNISLLLGNRNGQFTNAGTFSTETGLGPRSIVAQDFNLDGNMDIATANFNSNNVAVFLGTGQGSFTMATNFAIGDEAVGPIFIAKVDFNRDGKMDLATTNFSSENISILFNDGLGNFNSVNKIDLADAVGPRGLAIGDFNQDGNPDLATANFNTNNISILLGDGSFGIINTVNFDLGATLPFAIVSGDFNQDNFLDLATANGDNSVSILLGDGLSNFTIINKFDLLEGITPQSLQTADINQDGLLDLIAANSSSNNLSALLGDGTGNFINLTTLPLPLAKGVQNLITADFNLDNKLDLATANQTSGDISVLLNNCTVTCSGTFANANNITISDIAGPQSSTIADFNRDGLLDLATANPGNGNISLLLATGNNSFSGTNNFATGGIQPFSLTNGDFNRDGNFDIATVDVATNNVYVLLGDGTGNLGVSNTTQLTSSQPVAILTADFNRDGLLDLATANAGSNTISLLFGLGDGTFNIPIDFNLNGGIGPFSLIAEDFNRDGSLDLATANLGSNTISILLGSPFGFSLVNNFGVGSSSPRAIATGDFNRDGSPDIVVVNSGSNNLSILRNDGNANFTTLNNIQLSGAIKPVAVSVADLDLDGNLDIALANATTNNISLFFGNGNNSFVFDSNLPLGIGREPSSITIKDINKDTTPDLIVTNSSSLSVSLLLNLCRCDVLVSPSSLPIGQRLTNYNQSFAASGGVDPYNFSVTSGSLPSGLTLSANGELSGIPTQTGIFNFAVTVTDASGCSVNQSYSLLINSDPAVRLEVIAPTEVLSGQIFDIKVTAIDSSGNTASSYTGAITFSSSDSLALLPTNFSFNFSDLGTHTFAKAITLKNIGINTITVQDLNNPSISGTTQVIVNKLETKIAVNSLTNPSKLNSPATFIAVVTTDTATNSNPTGTITFIIDGVEQTPINIIRAEATFITSQLRLGDHQISAKYSGDALFNASLAPVIIQTIKISRLNEEE